MFDEYGYWTKQQIVVLVGVVAVLAFGIFAARDYKFVKKEPSIAWIQQPFTMEKNAQGQTTAAILVGFDEKGYVRWARQEVPPQPVATPATPPAAPVSPTNAPAKVEAKHG
jgi:hypothetical protein